MKVFVIVIVYNGLQNNWIKKCLDSLTNSDYPIEIIVVDNNSNDNSVEFIRSTYKRIILIEQKENQGFGRANNIGIKKAIENFADFIFLLNQDAVIEKNTISRLVEFAKANKQFGIVSPIHLNGKGTDIDFNFQSYLSQWNCNGFLSDLFFNRVKESYEVGFVNAASWLISKNCVDTVGGFNPVFFMYGEDDNYVHRLRYHGFKIGIITNAFIYHNREDRENGNNKYQFLDRLKDFSNPGNNAIIEDEKKAVQRQIFKNRFLFRHGRVKYFKNKLKELEDYPLDLTRNKLLSRKKGRTFL